MEQKGNGCSSDKEETHADHDGHKHGTEDSGWKSRLPLLATLTILLVMVTLEYGLGLIPPLRFDA